jgi:predicted metal-dependent phosphoesterase TrpH
MPTVSPTARAAVLSRPSSPPAVASNADLHSHSVFSDGTLTPSQLAARAHAQGVSLWALTDHDELGGLAEAGQAARSLGLAFLSGVEISVSYAGSTVHIVGLGVDPSHPGLCRGLASTRGGRSQRAQDIAAGLAAVGIAGAYESALQHAGNPDLIARSHFARALIERGLCRDFSEVFSRYMTEGKPGFVPHRWASLRDSVHWIRDAGGVAVIAHPGRYNFTSALEAAFFTDFIGHGGQAVEVVTGSHRPSEYAHYADLAREFKLAASRGSDFHCPQESRIDLGGLPALPSDLQPVWDLLHERIQ